MRTWQALLICILVAVAAAVPASPVLSEDRPDSRDNQQQLLLHRRKRQTDAWNGHEIYFPFFGKRFHQLRVKDVEYKKSKDYVRIDDLDKLKKKRLSAAWLNQLDKLD
ncbi:hypothetical protein BOX15_Mlig010118g2 [Macrostomum lignano]|uniref:Uncharacterized protein n=1 Tax=Macrostomum lignano TaxID=282301 RepID=A0A267FSN0_9PLAT|nr:hypothetical protein BOX15_Mlig010118g1 [Macrostomum lignano]PAA76009.1 hypothetical protein BOX15_Mlig010118g3 [Macrostomum lignano]PAA83872.1 hypothetical protein BOX15_Mlig010118g2 [Macrostomum lignano]